MAKSKSTTKEQTFDVLDVHEGHMELCVLSKTAYFNNRQSEKASHQILFPGRKKNQVERDTTLKHNPLEEFRASIYRLPETEPTLIAARAVAFKKAWMTAALDLPGTKKAQIGRLTWVEGELTALYGVPKIDCRTVRSADMNRTPDIRTRAVLPQWACRLQVRFAQPLMKAQAIVRLAAAAGLYIGVGDGRNEKGAFSFGAFELVEPDNEEFLRVIADGGRAAQEEAMQSPEPYNDETAELLTWFDVELNRRQMKGVA